MSPYFLPIGALILWLFYGVIESSIKDKKINFSVLKNKFTYLQGIILVILIGGLTYYEEPCIKLIFDSIVTFLLFALALVDIKEKVVSNKVIIMLAVVSVASVFVINKDNLINVGIAFLVISIVVFLLSKFTNEALGYGDAILLSILSLYYGLDGILMVLFLASLFVAIIGVFYLIKSFKNRKKEMPFVPFILVACILVNVLQ
ncbi:prepilin peptidase [Clostridium cibarium]|uniref:Prepilin peptidase n=1 Tax=Clostridium cibarium TaxID=2762247 RepID=A0ABR8PPN4_9CLOT|nr:prepilin peptidase [Clostridium cibarium]MBD7910125.1 prepilin peptidase [Clostridium cibarium]